MFSITVFVVEHLHCIPGLVGEQKILVNFFFNLHDFANEYIFTQNMLHGLPYTEEL